MNASILNLSRGLLRSVKFLESLIEQASAIVSELKEIKELLRLQNEQGKDTQLLTLEEAAAKLKVTVHTMSRWREAGVLVPIKIGCANYYRFSDIIKSGMNSNNHHQQSDEL